MIIGTAVQQPNDELDYDVDYTEWFGATADQLSTFSASVSPAGLNVLAAVASNNVGKLWISGGTAGTTYTITVTGVTTGSRVKEDEIIAIIEDF